jgi:YgiT-type zinc finger domain-containing protein
MIGKQEKETKETKKIRALSQPETTKKICPLCGGKLNEGLANLPFIEESRVLVVKEVPAEICEECGEAYLTGKVVDKIQAIFEHQKEVKAEVSVVHYQD